MGTEFYGAPDYEKARKIIEDDKLRVLIRERIGVTDCWHGKPLRPQWDRFYESVKESVQDYLDTYDATQEYNIDAILDFMPAEYTETGTYPAMGNPGDEWYVPPTPYDNRETSREMFMAMWTHEKGFAGWLEEEFQSLSGRDHPYNLADAKAFNRLCRPTDEENRNNAAIAEYILSEGIDPPSDADYKKSLKELNEFLDDGSTYEFYGSWPDFREEKGLPTNISFELVPNPDTEDGYPRVVRPITPQPKDSEVDENLEVYTTCGATRPKSHNTFVDPAYMPGQTNPNSGQASFDDFCAEGSDTVPFSGYVEDNDNSAVALGFAIIGGGVLLFGWLLAAIF